MERFLAFAACVIVFALIATPRKPLPAAPAVAASPAAMVAPAPAVVPSAPPPRASIGGPETVLPRAGDGHFYAIATVNGASVRFLVDTGASIVALTRQDAQRIGLYSDPAEARVIGTGASGPVTGTAVRLGEVEVEGKRASNVDAAVLDGLDVSLLGQSYLRQLSDVRIEGDTMTLR